MPGRSEGIAQNLVSTKLPTRIRMRYRDDIDTAMRVRLKTDGEDIIYQIIGGPSTVALEGRKTLIEILCEKYSS
jgi:head-tail adaptor